MLGVDEKMELVMIPVYNKTDLPSYACLCLPKCQKKERGTIIKAEGPIMQFPQSPVSASLLSYLIDMRYNKVVPLYFG